MVSDQLASDESPAWSRDGSRVAFISYGRNGQARRDLYVADFDGQRLQNLRALPGPVDGDAPTSTAPHQVACHLV